MASEYASFFSKERRLLTTNEFDHVFNGCKFRASNRFLLILTKPNQYHFSRLGLVIAKKSVRLAVERNRIKRLIRESFRLQQQQLPAIDAIVLARQGLDSQNNAEILKQLQQLWQKIEQHCLT